MRPPGRRRIGSSVQHPHHPDEQLVDGEGLAQVLVSPGAEAPSDVFGLPIRAQEDERHVHVFRHAPDPPEQIEAIQIRDVRVGDDEVGRPGLEPLERLGGALALDDVELLELEGGLEQTEDLDVIVLGASRPIRGYLATMGEVQAVENILDRVEGLGVAIQGA